MFISLSPTVNDQIKADQMFVTYNLYDLTKYSTILIIVIVIFVIFLAKRLHVLIAVSIFHFKRMIYYAILLLPVQK